MDNGGGKPGANSALEELRSHLSTGNARPVLQEILTSLQKLIETGEETTIDLGAIPFAAGDERIFDDILDDGEVKAEIDALGQSHIRETGIPGVWRIDHFDQNGETLSRFVEITFLPEILKTQRADAEEGLAQLTSRLEERDRAKH